MPTRKKSTECPASVKLLREAGVPVDQVWKIIGGYDSDVDMGYELFLCTDKTQQPFEVTLWANKEIRVEKGW